MKTTTLMVSKEWLNFTRSDRSVFFVYFILVVGWGMLIASTDGADGVSAPLWLTFFSVIIAANFSSTVFVAERMTGSLEILLTSGLSRSAILYGKVVFVIIMTLAIGALCGMVGLLFRPLISPGSPLALNGAAVPYVTLYVAATVFNAASGACFSVWLPNPRLLHFINLFILALVMSAFLAISHFFTLPLHGVSAFLLATGMVFMALARRAFDSERILKPVVL
ncbi:MAG: ABC transporter permease subunit [Chitinispirillaceae bacterium]|nr:ABC transporter permease subunit [Chitinispirillaceae bacterium]